MSRDRQVTEFSGFEILAEVGRGSTGVVYQARDTQLNRIVALKALVVGSETEHALRAARFLREARIVASLTREPDCNIPALYSVMEHDGQPYFVREFVHGQSLEQRVAAGAIIPREGIRILHKIASTVARVHAQGVAHCNLHPSNVLLNVDGVPKLIGFGRATFLAESELVPGVSAALDIQSLHQMLDWLISAFGKDSPRCLARMRSPDSLSSVSAFAAALEQALQDWA